MGNQKALDFYDGLASDADRSGSEKLKMGQIAVEHDIAFIRKHGKGALSLLDIGTGSGLILNQICAEFDRVLAIEPVLQLAKHISGKNIEIDTSNIFDFQTEEKFDLITLFGVCHHFEMEEAATLYKIIAPMLAPGGRVLVKNQLGRKETVTVDRFSEELGRHYFAQYRSEEDEQTIIRRAGLELVQVVDIYPPEVNRWPDTHYRALIIEARS